MQTGGPSVKKGGIILIPGILNGNRTTVFNKAVNCNGVEESESDEGSTCNINKSVFVAIED